MQALKQGMSLIAMGVAFGLTATYELTRFRSGLFGIRERRRQTLKPPLPTVSSALRLPVLEQPVKGPIKVMPSLIPVVMPVIFVWIVAILVVATRIVTTRIVATRIIAIGVIAIGVVDIRVGIHVLPLIPLRVGWNGAPH